MTTKILFLTLAISLCACNDSATNKDTTSADSSTAKPKAPAKVDEKNPPAQAKVDEKKVPTAPETKIYSNARFKDVSVKKTKENEYRISGMAQIFEASFSWVVEDGHEEIKKGHDMTDAGAPEWGKFNFTINVQKKRENSTLTLILFEISAKDGSRQYELPIPLPEN